jgi:hypothetical protein
MIYFTTHIDIGIALIAFVFMANVDTIQRQVDGVEARALITIFG